MVFDCDSVPARRIGARSGTRNSEVQKENACGCCVNMKAGELIKEPISALAQWEQTGIQRTSSGFCGRRVSSLAD